MAIANNVLTTFRFACRVVRAHLSLLVSHDNVRVKGNQWVVSTGVAIRPYVFPVNVVFDFEEGADFLRVEDWRAIKICSRRVASVRVLYIFRETNNRPRVPS